MALADPLPTPTPPAASTSACASEPTISVSGEQDAANADELFARLSVAISATTGDFVVDLSGVEFMGVATVRTLLRARRTLGFQSRALVLRNPSSSAQLVLNLCGVPTHESHASPRPTGITSAARAAAQRAWADGTSVRAESAATQLI